MNVKVISFNRDLFKEFPNSKYACRWDGGMAYKARKGRQYILWVDEREILDFLNPSSEDDEILSKDLVKLYIFDSKKERDKYIKNLKGLNKIKKSNKKEGFFNKIFIIIQNIWRIK
jgi:hypothetical protein